MNDIPVFPVVVPGHTYGDGSSELPYVRDNGMVLRDYFAAMALQSLIMTTPSHNHDLQYTLSKSAYLMADAMLVVRTLDIHKPETENDL